MVAFISLQASVCGFCLCLGPESGCWCIYSTCLIGTHGAADSHLNCSGYDAVFLQEVPCDHKHKHPSESGWSIVHVSDSSDTDSIFTFIK